MHYTKILKCENEERDFPGGLVVKICFVMQGMWVGFLIRKLRSHKPYDQKHPESKKINLEFDCLQDNAGRWLDKIG